MFGQKPNTGFPPMGGGGNQSSNNHPGAAPSNPFGNNAQSGNNKSWSSVVAGANQPSTTPFGNNNPSAASATTTFGSTAAPSGFSGPTFSSKSSTTTSGFGSSTSTSPFGKSNTSNTTTTGGGFGAASTAPAFGKPSSTTGFGKPSSSTSGFGKPNANDASSSSGPNASSTTFGSSSSNVSFGKASTTSTFGAPSKPSTAFGSNNSNTTTTFGAKSPAFKSPQPSATFGKSTGAAAFGASKSKDPGAKPVFGKPSGNSSSTFGSAKTGGAVPPPFGKTSSAPFGKPAAPSVGSPPQPLPTSASTKPLAGPGDSTPAPPPFGKKSSAPFGKIAASSAGAAFGKQTAKKSPKFGNKTWVPPESTENTTAAFGSTKTSKVKPLVRKKRVKPKNVVTRETEAAASPSPPPSPPRVSPRETTPSSGFFEDDDLDLSKVENLNGACASMCSKKEAEFRTRVDELSAFEKPLGNTDDSFALIVKRFQRSSADHKLNISSEVRPPGILRRTQLYLETELMDRERLGIDNRLNPPRVPDLLDLYNYSWDRTRMIRKDFILQNIRGGGRVNVIAIDVHERIARYHILSEHELCEEEHFVAQQNMEQLGQTLKSLNEYYDDAFKTAAVENQSPFEAEFRSYFILCTLDNGGGLDVIKYVAGLRKDIRENPFVKFAMKVFLARKMNDYNTFFELANSSTYLQGCLMHRYFPGVRDGALRCMNRAYKRQVYPVNELCTLLLWEDVEQTLSECAAHGLESEVTEDGLQVIRFGKGRYRTDRELRRDNEKIPTRRSLRVIGAKKGQLRRGAICRGVTEYSSLPSVSSAISRLEEEERTSLYPTLPQVQDSYCKYEQQIANTTPISFHPPPPPNIVEEKRARGPSLEQIQNAKDTVLQQQDALKAKLRKLEEKKQEEVAKEKKRLMALIAEKKSKAQAEFKVEQERKVRAQEAAEQKHREELRMRQEQELKAQKAKKQRDIAARKAQEAERLAKEAAKEAFRKKEVERAKKEAAELEKRRQEQEVIRLQKLEAERVEKIRIAEIKEKERQRRIREAEILQAENRRKAKSRFAILKFRMRRWKTISTYLKECRYNESSKRVWDIMQDLNICAQYRSTKSNLDRIFGPASSIHPALKSKALLAPYVKPHFRNETQSQDFWNNVRAFAKTSRTHFEAPINLAALVEGAFPLTRTVGWKLAVVMKENDDDAFKSWIKTKLGITTNSAAVNRSNNVVSCATTIDLSNTTSVQFSGIQSILVPIYNSAAKQDHLELLLDTLQSNLSVYSYNVHIVVLPSGQNSKVLDFKDLEAKYSKCCSLTQSVVDIRTRTQDCLSDVSAFEFGFARGLYDCAVSAPSYYPELALHEELGVIVEKKVHLALTGISDLNGECGIDLINDVLYNLSNYLVGCACISAAYPPPELSEILLDDAKWSSDSTLELQKFFKDIVLPKFPVGLDKDDSTSDTCIRACLQYASVVPESSTLRRKMLCLFQEKLSGVCDKNFPWMEVLEMILEARVQSFSTMALKSVPVEESFIADLNQVYQRSSVLQRHKVSNNSTTMVVPPTAEIQNTDGTKLLLDTVQSQLSNDIQKKMNVLKRQRPPANACDRKKLKKLRKCLAKAKISQNGFSRQLSSLQ